jgi:hypothetical protein
MLIWWLSFESWYDNCIVQPGKDRRLDGGTAIESSYGVIWPSSKIRELLRQKRGPKRLDALV